MHANVLVDLNEPWRVHLCTTFPQLRETALLLGQASRAAALATDADADALLPHAPRADGAAAPHIVALLAICTDSKLLRSGVSRRVMVDGESFVDALFACACRG